MTKCVPIKEMKNTAAFAQMVEESSDPVIVTKNGYEKFAVMTVEKLDSLRMDAARALLYDRVESAESDFTEGRVIEAAKSQLFTTNKKPAPPCLDAWGVRVLP